MNMEQTNRRLVHSGEYKNEPNISAHPPTGSCQASPFSLPCPVIPSVCHSSCYVPLQYPVILSLFLSFLLFKCEEEEKAPGTVTHTQATHSHTCTQKRKSGRHASKQATKLTCCVSGCCRLIMVALKQVLRRYSRRSGS